MLVILWKDRKKIPFENFYIHQITSTQSEEATQRQGKAMQCTQQCGWMDGYIRLCLMLSCTPCSMYEEISVKSHLE